MSMSPIDSSPPLFQPSFEENASYGQYTYSTPLLGAASLSDDFSFGQSNYTHSSRDQTVSPLMHLQTPLRASGKNINQQANTGYQQHIVRTLRSTLG
jgi:hypothetical protein